MVKKTSICEFYSSLSWLKSSEIIIYLFILYLSHKKKIQMDVYTLLYKFEDFFNARRNQFYLGQ